MSGREARRAWAWLAYCYLLITISIIRIIVG